MQTTLFYSWQSDTNAKTNRNFIKNCLEKAIQAISRDLTIDDALRLDHDTKGEAGIPDIANTIFKKIEQSQIFVADVTFIGTIENEGIPNPNVLIELGYALKAINHSKFILVMNTNFGDPETVPLPFDLNHKRWPIRYNLSLNDPESDFKRKREGLTSALKAAITTILNEPEKLTKAEPVQRFSLIPLPYEDVKIGTLYKYNMVVDIFARIILQEFAEPDVSAFLRRVHSDKPYCLTCSRPLIEVYTERGEDFDQTGYSCRNCGPFEEWTALEVHDEMIGEVRRNYSDYYQKYQQEIERITGGQRERFTI